MRSTLAALTGTSYSVGTRVCSALPVGSDELLEVVDEVEADQLDAPRRSSNGFLGGVAPLDGGSLVIRAVGEHPVEDGVQVVADDAKLPDAQGR